MFYILNEDKSISTTEDTNLYALNQEKNHRVAYSSVNDVGISTIFLGIDHSFGSGPPLLFETMDTRGGEWNDDTQVRYYTYDEALRGHYKRVLEVVKEQDDEREIESP